MVSLGVRSDYVTKIDIPLLSGDGRRQFMFDVQRQAAKESRKAIATPNRKRAPVRTGTLKKTIRVSGRPRASRNRKGKNLTARGNFPVMAIRYKYWYVFQPEYYKMRSDIEQHMPGITQRAIDMALRNQGYG